MILSNYQHNTTNCHEQYKQNISKSNERNASAHAPRIANKSSNNSSDIYIIPFKYQHNTTTIMENTNKILVKATSAMPLRTLLVLQTNSAEIL